MKSSRHLLGMAPTGRVVIGQNDHIIAGQTLTVRCLGPLPSATRARRERLFDRVPANVSAPLTLNDEHSLPRLGWR
jgi:hypothetical protein